VLGQSPFHESDRMGEASKRTLSLSSTTSSNAVQERPHSKTSSQAGTSVGSSSHSANSLSLNWRDSRPPRDDNQNGSGNDYTRLMMSDRRQKIVVCVFEVGNYDDQRAVQERPHSKTSSQAGTSVGSSSHSANDEGTFLSL